MRQSTSTAIAHPNLALVKYWGARDASINVPLNDSISLNLGGLFTRTSVRFDATLDTDVVNINGVQADSEARTRVVQHLNLLRQLAAVKTPAQVTSTNSFPAATGMASSASAFAALTLAASHALELDLNLSTLSRLARRGSGSACRSLPGGFVEWHAGYDDESSYAESIAPAQHWDLRVLSVVVDSKAKAHSSLEGHRAAYSSPLLAARLQTLPQVLYSVRSAILQRDFEQLALVVERDAVNMHAIAMTSSLASAPWLSGLYYWQAATLDLIHAVQDWRRQGIAVCFTIDAGANVHLLCPAAHLDQIHALVRQLDQHSAWQCMSNPIGEAAYIVDATAETNKDVRAA